jgi:hypothetical protein
MWATASASGGLWALEGRINQAEVCMSFVSITFEMQASAPEVWVCAGIYGFGHVFAQI